jgi:rSAM/selenodomain-associated transferase 1
MNSSYKYPHARILLFCKAPIPGQVKTRLVPVLGKEGACELHCRLVNHIAATLLEGNLCPIEFWVTPDASDRLFTPYHGLGNISFHHQIGNDLGQRMFNGVQDALDQADGESRARADYVLLIGSDCPALSLAYLDKALSRLEAGYDAVLGPALDGGYVMLGLSRVEPSLFQAICWGTDAVAAETCRRMNSLDWNWSLAKTLWDVDTPEDLARLNPLGLRDQAG